MVRLLNRRFIAVSFDLSNRGALGDSAARAFVVRAKPELGRGMVGTPPVLVMTAAGQVLAELSNYGSTKEMLALLTRVLRENPDYNAYTETEKAAKSPLQRARILSDLQRHTAALGLLARPDPDDDASEVQYLRARLSRDLGRWDDHAAALALVVDETRHADVLVERAHRLRHDRAFQKMRASLDDFPKDHPRYTEARYLQGLAAFHAGARDEAIAIWKSTIRGCSQDPWIYRADWAYTECKQGNRGSFSTSDKAVSLLNRIGYMGVRHPDLITK